MAINKEEHDKLKASQKVTDINNYRLMPPDLITNEKGIPKASSYFNVTAILDFDPILGGKLIYNEFTQEIETTEDITLNIRHRNHTIPKGVLDERFYSYILSYIDERYNIAFSANVFQVGLNNAADERRINPVQNYLNKCYQNWDGKTRVDTFLPDFLGVEYGPVTTIQTKIFFTGAVAKAFNPRTKFDYVLDLVGGQGTGKTTLIEKMAGEWYTDQFNDFENKDNYANMLRSLIINDDEMTATANSTFEILKKFISMQEISYRPPYGHRSIRRPKGFVMMRTSNHITYLQDKTGERRFLPNLVRPEYQKLNPFTDLTPELVSQLWGEFTSYYKNGFSLTLSKEDEKAVAEHRERFAYIDEVEEQIEDALHELNRNFVTTEEIALQMGVKNIVSKGKLAKKIKYVMDNKKNWKIVRKRMNGKQQRGYQRVP